MDLLLLCCIALLVLFSLSFFDSMRRKKQQAKGITSSASESISKEDDSKLTLEERLQAVEAQECCGTHAVCEKEQMIRALRQRIEYFNDEELDDYRGIAPEEYTDEQIDEFREVLYTMRPDEIEDWLKSLELRQVALPLVLKEEACTLIADERSKRTVQ